MLMLKGVGPSEDCVCQSSTEWIRKADGLHSRRASCELGALADVVARGGKPRRAASTDTDSPMMHEVWSASIRRQNCSSPTEASGLFA